MSWQGRLAIAGVVVGALGESGVLPGAVGLPLLIVSVLAAWRYADGFWRIVATGIAGGLIAGLLILGPGFRVAMRVVALMDPSKTPEFTVGGTFFIVIVVGGMFGAINGVSGNLIRKAAGLSSLILSGGIAGGLVLTIFVSSADLREELATFGAGTWVNLPLFGVFALAYGIAAIAIADQLDRRTTKPSAIERKEVPA
ncbi:MAG: hypothetical protein WBM90_06480 [Acidimicrobiia bacterium]